MDRNDKILLQRQTELAREAGRVDGFSFLGFWIEHNCKKMKGGYLIMDKNTKQISEGKTPTM